MKELNVEMMEIKTSFGGPCIYKRGIFPDGTETGRIQDVGQGIEQIKRQLMNTLESGRDDVRSFVNMVRGS